MPPQSRLRILWLFPLIAAWTGCATAPANDPVAPVIPATQSPPPPADIPRGVEPVDPSEPASTWVLHRIADPEDAEHTAYSMLMPEGWSVEGGLTWSGAQLYQMPTVFDVRAAGPGGRAARLYPKLTFSHGQEFARRYQPGQPTQEGTLYFEPPEDLGAWLVDLARSYPAPGVSDVRLIEQGVLPKATESYQLLRRDLYDMARQTSEAYRGVMGPQPVTQSYAAQADHVVLGYQRDGLTIREDFILLREGWWVTQGQNVISGTWSISGMVSAAGPVDGAPLADAEVATIVQSARPTAYWTDRLTDFQRQLQKIIERQQPYIRPVRPDAEVARQQARNAEAQGHALMMGAWDEAAAGESSSAAPSSMKRYAFPDGETLQLPADFTGVITHEDQRYLIDEDAVYDPAAEETDMNGWLRLEPLPTEPATVE